MTPNPDTLSDVPASYAELVAEARQEADDDWYGAHDKRLIDKLADTLEALSRESEARGEALDAAYIAIIDTCGFLRGNGDVCEVAANRLIKQVPEEFDEREEDARTALGAKP